MYGGVYVLCGGQETISMCEPGLNLDHLVWQQVS